MADKLRRLSDEEFDLALGELENGRVPFASPEMLRRFGETIVAKLWEAVNEHEEPEISS